MPARLLATTFMQTIKLGATATFISNTVMSQEISVVYFLRTSISGILMPALPLFVQLVMPTLKLTCPLSSAVATHRLPSRNVSSKPIAVVAMLNSTLSLTAVPSLVCNLVGVQNQFQCHYHRKCAGATTGSQK